MDVGVEKKMDGDGACGDGDGRGRCTFSSLHFFVPSSSSTWTPLPVLSSCDPPQTDVYLDWF